MDKYWKGFVKPADAFGSSIQNEFVDGKTTLGPWAIMAPISYQTYGMGLGIGYGQKYQKQEDGKWLRVDGGKLVKKHNIAIVEKIDIND